MERVDYQSLVIQDLINLFKNDQLNLNPWYQRRSVWNDSQKSYLINTLFESKPIPAIYIRHSIDLDREKTVKEVVDGQQRIRAILGFRNDEFSSLYPGTGSRVKFSALTNVQKQKFLMTAIPVGYLQGATDADVIDIFARINSVAKSLNSQEKRNSKFSGLFKQFCITQSTKRLEFFRQYGVFSANDFARMNEVQFMSDVIINLMEGLTSYSSRKLDEYYKRYDECFDQSLSVGLELDELFDTIVQLSPDTLRNTIFNRPPLFFSLLLALKGNVSQCSIAKLEQGLLDIDARYHLDVSEKTDEDIEFYNAVSATTQGMGQRRTRDIYLKKYIF